MFWKKKPPAPLPPEPVLPGEPVPPEPAPERRFTDRLRQPETFIAQAIRITGDIEGRDAIEIAGNVRGKVTTRGLCRVSAGAQLTGRLSAVYAVIDGAVKGNVTVRRKVELGHTARVEGDIRAEGVAMAEGAFYDGRIQMQGGTPHDPQQPFQEKRRNSR